MEIWKFWGADALFHGREPRSGHRPPDRDDLYGRPDHPAAHSWRVRRLRFRTMKSKIRTVELQLVWCQAPAANDGKPAPAPH